MTTQKEQPQAQVDERAMLQSRRIKNKFNVYLSETSSENPFGPNSPHASLEEKLVYKYNIMKEFIKLSTKDELNKEYQQSRFLGTMILGFVGGYFVATPFTMLLNKFKLSRAGSIFDTLIYASLMTGGFAWGYFEAHKRYNRNVCGLFLQKYMKQAIENGFQNYEIVK